MPDEPDTQPPAPQTPPAPTAPPTNSPPASEDDLPEWVRKELKTARGEAANYRTQLRDAQKSLEGAKSDEDIEKVRNELTARAERAEREALVATVARKYGLDDVLAAALQGASAQEIEAHAKALQPYVQKGPPTPPPPLKGGLKPNEPADDDGDPVEVARRALARRA
jgi:hypothetical protein